MTDSYDRLIKSLEGVDTKIRWLALESLYQCSLHAGSEDRARAALELGKTLDGRALKTLAKALNDSDVYVRRSAAVAIGMIGGPIAIKALIKALGDSDLMVCRNSATCLVNLGDIAAGPLCKALESPNGQVRRNAAQALGNMNSDRALCKLVRMLGETDPLVLAEVVGALVKIGALSVGQLIAALEHTDTEIRRNAAKTLWKIADVRAVEALCAALGDSDPVVSWAAKNALVRLGEPSVTGLINAINDPNRGMRTNSAGALGMIGDVRGVEALVAALADPNSDVRTKAAEALGVIGESEDLARRILVQSNMSTRAKVAAINALHSRQAQYLKGGRYIRYNIADARRFCQQMKSSDDATEREAALELLRYQDNQFVVPSQRNELSTQNELLRGISGYESEESGAQLLRGADSQSTLVIRDSAS